MNYIIYWNCNGVQNYLLCLYYHNYVSCDALCSLCCLLTCFLVAKASYYRVPRLVNFLFLNVDYCKTMSTPSFCQTMSYTMQFDLFPYFLLQARLKISQLKSLTHCRKNYRKSCCFNYLSVCTLNRTLRAETPSVVNLKNGIITPCWTY